MLRFPFINIDAGPSKLKGLQLQKKNSNMVEDRYQVSSLNPPRSTEGNKNGRDIKAINNY